MSMSSESVQTHEQWIYFGPDRLVDLILESSCRLLVVGNQTVLVCAAVHNVLLIVRDTDYFYTCRAQLDTAALVPKIKVPFPSLDDS